MLNHHLAPLGVFGHQRISKRIAELLAEALQAGGVARARLVELSLPRLHQTLGQLGLVEFILRPGTSEKDEQIADRRDGAAALFDRSRFDPSPKPMSEPAVDSFAAGLVVIVGRVYLDRRQLVFGVEEFVYPPD